MTMTGRGLVRQILLAIRNTFWYVRTTVSDPPRPLASSARRASPLRVCATGTAAVSKGIAAFADARAAGLSAIEDFFSAPVSGFGDGVRLRVTTGKGSTARRQVVVLDRWD